MMDNLTQLVLVSDLHINSTVGLCPPRVNLDDGGTYNASRSQRWLWDCWIDFIQRVNNLAGSKVVVINGDMGELDTKRRSTQIITPNKATIQSMVLDAIAPLVDAADTVIVMRGTSAHTGKGEWLEEAVAKDLDHCLPQNAKQGIASHYHFQGQISGVRVDVAHHASMGSLPWTRAGSANRLAFLATHHYMVTLGVPPPHLVIRAHNHRYTDSGRNHTTKAIFLPAWQLITEFGYRIGRELELSDIGGVIVECNGGQYQDELVLYETRGNNRTWSIKL
jgi:hypothetical protein